MTCLCFRACKFRGWTAPRMGNAVGDAGPSTSGEEAVLDNLGNSTVVHIRAFFSPTRANLRMETVEYALACTYAHMHPQSELWARAKGNGNRGQRAQAPSAEHASDADTCRECAIYGSGSLMLRFGGATRWVLEAWSPLLPAPNISLTCFGPANQGYHSFLHLPHSELSPHFSVFTACNTALTTSLEGALTHGQQS